MTKITTGPYVYLSNADLSASLMDQLLNLEIIMVLE